MEQILTIPVAVVIILGLTTQLGTVAESSADKAVAFADDMNNAIDCATRGIALEVCSPNLMSHDFEPEINATIKTSIDMIEETDRVLEESTAS